jgi:hypothetical protein
MKKNRFPQKNVWACLWSISLLLSAGAAGAAELTAQQIMEKTFESRKLDGSESVMTLTIYNAKGEKRVREIAMVTKMYDDGKTEKKLYRFMQPADVKGTGVLAFDYEGKEDDMWIFLPALRKTRKIVSSDKSKNFMGSEFSYADMNQPVLSSYNLKKLADEKVGGTDCYTIEVVPKNDKVADEEGYSKKIIWIGKKDFMVRQSKFFDLDGELMKILTAKTPKLVDKNKKRYRLMYMEMVNKQNNRKSVFQTSKIELAPNAKDNYFTTSYLERP